MKLLFFPSYLHYRLDGTTLSQPPFHKKINTYTLDKTGAEGVGGSGIAGKVNSMGFQCNCHITCHIAWEPFQK